MKKLLALSLALLMLFSLFACGKKEEPAPAGQNANADDTPARPATVRVATLNGTTGFGMAPLISKSNAGQAALPFAFTVEADATVVRDGLINGTFDIGAVPTNVAAVIYNRTQGGVKVLALNTRGVLYLVTKGDATVTLADLSGKTVYCPAQNPAFITAALLGAANVANVTLDSTTYAAPAELRDAAAAGLVDYAVLPEPMVTIARSKAAQTGVTLTVSVDLTAAWDQYFPAGSLVQGCVVARTDFINAYPDAVSTFLTEYAASIAAVTADPDTAAQQIVDAGIFAQAPVAKAAIPKCNLCYVTGADMKAALGTFLAAMPLNSIGGALPDDAFYYGA